MDLTKNSFINSTFILFSQASGFIRDILIAAFLGSGILSNIYVIALRLPFSFMQSLSGEAFHSSFIPTLSSIEGKDVIYKRYQFAKNILWISLLLLIPFILLVELYMPSILRIIAPGFADNSKFDLLLLCSRISFPYLIFIVMSSSFAGLLNYKKRFSVTAFLPVLLNLSVIMYIIFSPHSGENKVIYLCWSLLMGGLLQISFLLFFTDKDFWYSSFNLKDGIDEIRKFFKLLTPTFFSQTFIQINVLVGVIFASFYEGAVSYIYFADRVYMFPLTLIGMSIATVLIPDLSRNISINDMNSALKVQNKAYKLVVAAALPAATILFMLSQEMIQFIYQRGEFTSYSTKNTASVLQLFSIGLPAMCLNKILSPYYFAKDNPKTPFNITSISVLINIFLTLILFQFMGYLSIPLSISITAFITLIMYILDHKKAGFFNLTPEIIKYTAKYAILCIGLSFEILILKEMAFVFDLSVYSMLIPSLIFCLISLIIFIKIFDKEIIEDMKLL